MMKFVLISITVILAGLGIYTYSNQSTERSNSSPTISKQEKEVKQIEKSLSVTPGVTKEKSSAKNITVKSPKVVSKESIQEMRYEEEIGKSITQEDIDNAENDEEREKLRMDMLYYHSKHNDVKSNLTEEEIQNMLLNDLKENLIN